MGVCVSENEQARAPEGKANVDELRFHYIKSGSFRAIHVDGAAGGVTARGYIHAAVYNERQPITRVSVSTVNKDGAVGPERPLRRKRHVVRELEVDLIFDLKTAEEFGTWLLRKAEELRKVLPLISQNSALVGEDNNQ